MVMIDAPDVIRPAPSHIRNVTFSTLRPIKMGESIKTTGIVKPLKPITIPMGAKSIAIQRDKVPNPKNIPPKNNRKIPCLEYEIFLAFSI